MTTLLSVSNGAPRLQPTQGDEERGTGIAVLAFEHPALRVSNEAVCLDACRQFERIVVHTRASVYEVIVLRGDKGSVLVRGGRKFPEFRCAVLAGSTGGGRALKLNTIDVGLRMEFCADDRVIVTSPVKAVIRQQMDQQSVEPDA